MFKAAIKEFSVFSEAESKAMLNSIIIPLILTLLSSNLLIGLCWVLLVTVIYKFIQKEKTENAAMFFTFLKVLSLVMIGIVVLIFVTIVIK